MTPRPRVSVVMPVRDGERWLDEAVGSILAQTMHELELVVVDDGSTDGSPRLLAGAAERDARVRILRHDRQGLTAALDRGVRASQAEYVARMDADDVALPQRLELQAAFLDARPDVALVGGAVIATDEEGKPCGTLRYPVGDRAIRVALRRYNCFVHPAVMFRRSAYLQAGGYRIDRAQDYDLWLRLAEEWRLANLSEPVLRYRQHRHQISVAGASTQALAMLGARAAARRRAEGGQDTLVEGGRIGVPELARLGVATKEIQRALFDAHVRGLALTGDSGAGGELDAVADELARYGIRPGRRRLAAAVVVEQAKAAFRRREVRRAALLLARGFSLHPQAVPAGLCGSMIRRRAL